MLYLSCPVGPAGAHVIVTALWPSEHKGFSVVRHGVLVHEVHDSDLSPPTEAQLEQLLPTQLDPIEHDASDHDMPIIDQSFESVYSCGSCISEEEEEDPLVGCHVTKRFPGYGLYTGKVRCLLADERYAIDWHDGSESTVTRTKLLAMIK